MGKAPSDKSQTSSGPLCRQGYSSLVSEATSESVSNNGPKSLWEDVMQNIAGKFNSLVSSSLKQTLLAVGRRGKDRRGFVVRFCQIRFRISVTENVLSQRQWLRNMGELHTCCVSTPDKCR